MSLKKSDPGNVVEHFSKRKILGIRCGNKHKFIGLWPVVVEDRIFVRSWALKKSGWYNAFLTNPQGEIQFEGKEIAIMTRRVNSHRLNKLINKAYQEKYDTPGAAKYVKDLTKKKSVNSTLELILFVQKKFRNNETGFVN